MPRRRCEARPCSCLACRWGDAEEERALLGELLSPTTALEVQLAALERLVAFHDRESSEQLLSRWPNLSYSLRDAAAMQLVSSAVSTEVLLEQLESGAILPGDLSPAVRQTLRQSGSQSTKTRVSRVLGKTTAANQELVQRYLEFQQDASQAADVSRGQELFRKHCAVCHVPDADGFSRRTQSFQSHRSQPKCTHGIDPRSQSRIRAAVPRLHWRYSPTVECYPGQSPKRPATPLLWRWPMENGP